MLKKTMTCIDYDGNERTGDLYFNLTKTEIAEMEVSFNGGLIKTVEKIIQEKDTAKVLAIFKDIVHKSYGEKSLDGKRFIKNQFLIDAFTQTVAYDELFFDLITNADKAAEFINGIIPQVKQ